MKGYRKGFWHMEYVFFGRQKPIINHSCMAKYPKGSEVINHFKPPVDMKSKKHYFCKIN